MEVDFSKPTLGFIPTLGYHGSILLTPKTLALSVNKGVMRVLYPRLVSVHDSTEPQPRAAPHALLSETYNAAGSVPTQHANAVNYRQAPGRNATGLFRRLPERWSR